jgi:hypothetical protein
MKLQCFAVSEFAPKLIAARQRRPWMDEIVDRHAYRCLPLNIANSHGWEVLCPVPIEIEWNGGAKVEDLTVKALRPLPGKRPLEHFCRSHFSAGIVTFHVDYIFRTDKDWTLLATGPFNAPKDNAAPLTGIIETDWLPYTFTMNWKVLRPGLVRFEEDEPFCFIFPLMTKALVDCEPELLRLSDDPILSRQHEAFRDSRSEYQRQRAQAGLGRSWQKHYFMGRHADGTPAQEHMHRLRLAEPVDRRLSGPVDLERSHNRPSADNRAGQSRIDADGRLGDRAGIATITSAAAARDRDFLVVDGLLSRDQCDLLCRVFRELDSLIVRSETIDPFWNERYIWHTDIARERPEAGRIMLDGLARSIERVSAFYSLIEPIHPDLLQIVRWRAGSFMRPHADNAHPDGSEHKMASRDFSGILYLNDDYEGGELFFTGQNVTIRPQAGMMVAFTAGFHHQHGVLRVESGTRLTMPFFLTFDREKADARLIDLIAEREAAQPPSA